MKDVVNVFQIKANNYLVTPLKVLRKNIRESF